MHIVCVFLKYVILRALHRMNTKIIALTLVAVAIVAALLVFALSSGGDDDRDDGSDATVVDYAGRTVNIPENLDDGIVTIGRLSTLRWLAYFPQEMEHVSMIDLGIQKSVESGALAYSYAYSDILKKAKTHSNDNLDDADAIAKLKPSLVLVNSSTYNSYASSCDSLGALYPLAVIDTMSDIEATGFWDSDYKLIDRFTKQADLYGKLLKNEKRAEEVKKIFQGNIDQIRSFSKGTVDTATYVGGPVNQGNNSLTSTYNPYPTLSIVGGVHALGGKTATHRIDLSPEEVQRLRFNTMVVDPGTFGKGKGHDGSLLFSPNSQGVLLDVYGRNGNADKTDDVRIFITLPTISHGANWDCVLAGSYYMAYLHHGSMTQEQMWNHVSKVFSDLYTEARGGAVLQKVCDYYKNVMEGVDPGIKAKVFGEVRVATSSGKYILTEA